MKRIVIIAALSVFAVSAALASDLPLKAKKKAAAPVAPVVTVAHAKAAATPAPAPKTNSISVELGPELYGSGTMNNAGKPTGAIKDWTGKVGYSHTFEGVYVAGASYSHTAFYNLGETGATGSTSAASDKSAAEASVAYKYKMGDFTITPGAALGYAWGWVKIDNEGGYKCSSLSSSSSNGYCYNPEAYYVATVALDWKVSSDITWNVIGLRYRDAFSGNWNTPKVSTGATVSLTPEDSLYASISYSYKNYKDHTLQVSPDYDDVTGITFGYKHAF